MACQDFAGKCCRLPSAQSSWTARIPNYHLKLGQIYGEMAARANFLSAGSLAVKFRKEVEVALALSIP